MGITVHAPESYQKSILKLFPRGAYWDKQFSDPTSDCSLFCKAKADLIIRIRKRMAALQEESIIQTADETLDDWDRVLLGVINLEMDTAQRKALLSSSKAGSFSIETIKEIGRMYDITITDIIIPFRPAFFGHSHFGIDPIASPASFSVIFVYAAQPGDGIQEDFEKQLRSRALSNYIIYFIYGGS